MGQLFLQQNDLDKSDDNTSGRYRDSQVLFLLSSFHSKHLQRCCSRHRGYGGEQNELCSCEASMLEEETHKRSNEMVSDGVN